jgi:hypothetical protein
MNKYEAYIEAANDAEFMEEIKSMNPHGYVDPVSKYYNESLVPLIEAAPDAITDLRRRVAKANELSGGYDNRGNRVLGAFLTGILQEYDTLRAERDALQKDNEVLREEVHMQLMELGMKGIGDHMSQYLRADDECNKCGALLKVYEAAEDFIGAQGTAYEDDQYLMLCGVVGAYNQQRGIHESQ